jgi:hypothetical protein
LFNIRELHITTEEALGYAYGAGFDEKVKVNGRERAIEYTDKEGRKGNYPSISYASRKLKVHRETIMDACRLGRRTRKGYYFRYADTKKNKVDEDKKVCQTSE